ncbi:DUF4261 domain-containing protein [Neobacillus niacini]|uniref:DUF4261 domain-containing protein n=1 Tax=Neobacillus niacini TaxID=86668 RepID=UPI0005EE3F60|nr:DUF4261 domain-containing protein [Neobacillus niacini]
MEKTQIVIGIPGKWKSRTEIIQAVASKSGGYLMAGNIIHNAQKNVGFQVEVYEYDSNLSETFKYACRGSISKEVLVEVDNHTYTLYVITDVKDIQDVKNVVDLGVGLLKAGGIAVKIENSGLAHSKEDWLELQNNPEYFPLYSHFVTLIGEGNVYYSCGMQVFGLPDVITSSQLSPEDAADLINNFNLYNLVERPSIKEGETFSVGQDTSVMRIAIMNDSRYDEDNLFYNPFGLIELREKKEKGKFWNIFK